MLGSDGKPHAHTQRFYDVLSGADDAVLANIQERVTRSFLDQGISFTLYDENEMSERMIPIDCIPRIMPSWEWEELKTGLTQRLTALNCFLDDVYHDGNILREQVIPTDLVRGCPSYRVEMRGFNIPNKSWVSICGTDIVRTNEGFRVLEDNLRVPSGVSYMIANRSAVKANFPRTYRNHRVHEVSQYGELLYQTLVEMAPEGVSNPVIAVLTPGVFNSAFYEHMFLADELGADLVEGQDLLIKDGYVYARTTRGLQRIDVLYRRVDDEFLDPLVFRHDSMLGVPGLMQAFKLGRISVVNAPGTGVADDKSVYAYVPDMIRYYLGQEPKLQNVETHLCRRPEALEFTLDNLSKLVVKPVGGSGGYGLVIGPDASPEELNDCAERLRADPKNYISQPTLDFSRSPCLIDSSPQPRHVDLRPFILHGQETRLVPGAFCRVALREGSRVVNSSQGGGGKDLWVLRE